MPQVSTQTTKPFFPCNYSLSYDHAELSNCIFIVIRLWRQVTGLGGYDQVLVFNIMPFRFVEENTNDSIRMGMVEL